MMKATVSIKDHENDSSLSRCIKRFFAILFHVNSLVEFLNKMEEFVHYIEELLV
jgi:hypothetical protein